LRLLWLASPALPTGAYAYSRGLELAVERGWVRDAASAHAWIAGLLARQVATLDAPLLARFHDAFTAGAAQDVERYRELSCAARETAELQLEDEQLGLALARVLRDAGVPHSERCRELGSFVAVFAHACVHFGIERRAAVTAFLFMVAENQLIAAIKLVPLGQGSGQAVLGQLLACIETLADAALALGDDEIGAFTPGLSLASALHETQYTRLFRS
jgi:urease accessory protein